ncbi:MAG TPA: rhodanese-like domain-containing protein [Defluviicoccus sp.]|nr:rhodanese-like domain-containing protein [Defluviicoccus sp.]
MADPREQALISTDWLADALGRTDIKILDGSFHIPGSGRDARAEYARCHIEGAQFFDIDGICDRSSPLPHMLPGADAFAETIGRMGIGSNDHVIVYDAPGSCAAPRVWWTFRVFGHDRVAVLDGGLAKWQAEGRAVTNAPTMHPRATFRATFRPHLVRSAANLIANLKDRANLKDGASLEDRREQVVDNRGPGRFAGLEPEPRPVRRLGHIPGSRNIPFFAFIDVEHHGTWRDNAALARAFADAGVYLARPLVGSCGSGVTAATTAFAAFLLGRDDDAVYDGSWAEWGNRDDTPIERDAA